MAQSSSRNKQLLVEVAYLGFSMLGSWLLLRWALKQLDPNKNAKAAAQRRKKEIEKRLGRPVHTDGNYEDIIANEVVNPAHINVSLNDIGGMEHIISDLRRNIIMPMQQPQLFHTTLLRQKRGVLLYGPPGTGKTMLAKALAKECGACFINLKSSTILSKWYGDTNKLISAVWTLARKLQPCIIFVDEVDSLLGHRRNLDHEATTAMKTEFMQLWEGFETTSSNIVVLGATNKKENLDDAVLRRFSLQYEVKLPTLDQRRSILRLTLARHAAEMRMMQIQFGVTGTDGVDPNLLNDRPDNSHAHPLTRLAEQTAGFSGSDLNELCSQAAVLPVHEFIHSRAEAEGEPLAGDPPAAVWSPLSLHHFEQVLESFHPPSRAAQEQRKRQQLQQQMGAGDGGLGNNGGNSEALLLRQMLLAMQQALGQSQDQ